jgi:hypothetical protein
MPIDHRKLHVPADTPVVIHRHGPGRYSVAVVVEGGPGDLTEAEAREALARWRARLGGWMTKRSAADELGLSVKMVDALRRSGRLKARLVRGQVRVTVKSVQEELIRRRRLAADSKNSEE